MHGRRLAVLTAAGVLGLGATAHAGTIAVDSQADDGSGGCTLREALTYAGAPAAAPDGCSGATDGADTIEVPAGTYTLAGTELTSTTGTVTIHGAGQGTDAAANTIISGNNASRVLHVTGGDVTLDSVRVIGGRAAPGAAGVDGDPNGKPGADGGGILNEGSLTVRGATVAGNVAGAGGNGYNGGSGTLPNGGDTGGAGGNGGGISNSGTLRLVDATVADNVAGAGGGGVRDMMSDGGQSGEGGDGGGVFSTGTLTATGTTTLSGNKAGAGGTGVSINTSGKGGRGGDGGAIATGGSGSATLTGSVLTGNASGAGGNSGTCVMGVQSFGGGAGGDGGGVHTTSTGAVALVFVDVSNNTTGVGGTGGGADTSATGTMNGGDGGAGGSGGGLAVASGAGLRVDRSTITRNATAIGGIGGAGNVSAMSGAPGAAGSGGGIATLAGGTTGIHDSTIATNRTPNATGSGDGAYAGGALVLDAVTLAYNHRTGDVAAGSGLFVAAAGTASLSSTLASTNGAANCAGTAATAGDGHNLSFPEASCPAAVTTDPQIPAAPAAPADPLPLLLPAKGSPALDQIPAGMASGCDTTDQRGANRPQGAGCDIGAVERLGNADVDATAISLTGATLTVTANSEGSGTAQLLVGRTEADLAPNGDPVTVTAGQVAPATAVRELTGLAPDTTYVAQVRLTGDEPVTGPVRSFKTLAPTPTSTVTPTPTTTATPTPTKKKAKVSIVKLSTTAKTVKARLKCTGATCKVKVVATTKKKLKRKRVRIGSKRATIKAGKRRTVTLKISQKGRRLVKRLHRLPITVSVTGAGKKRTGSVTIRPKK